MAHTKVIIIERIEVIQTRDVNGASKSNFSTFGAKNLVMAPFTQYATTEVIIIKNLITKIQASN